jgi:CDGSH-type Zn-finger protein
VRPQVAVEVAFQRTNLGRRVRIVRGDTEEIIEKPAVALCRCGQSSNKPLCDGTHKTAEFGEPEATIELLEPPVG